MTKAVVLAEKPSVARDIARVLGCNKKGNGYLEGSQYIVTWALGHLVTHADPEGYGPQYKQWTLEQLPILPEPFKLVPIRQTTKQYKAVTAQLRRTDVSSIIIATDAGREGELVARWILKQATCKKPIKRLWISSVTDKAIKEGFASLQPGEKYDHLYEAAVARAEADWVVGINATRALTVKYNAQLSTGRVQTPTLAMIAEREKQIQQFTPQTFYRLQARTERAIFEWQLKNQSRTFDQQVAEETEKKLKSIKVGTIQHVKKVQKQQPAPPLFDLTELQKEAHKRWSWSAKETLNVLQGLYEYHKAVTYPRTDSKHLTTDMVGTLEERIKAVDIQPFRKATTKLLRASSLELQKGVVNNQKVSDHHAIIPTEETPAMNDLSTKEKQLYEMITFRFLAQFYPTYRYEQVTATLQIGTETFTTKGQAVVEEGWKALFTEKEQSTIPSFIEGEEVAIQQLQLVTGKTTPPPRFNEGTLLAAMENPKQFMVGESKELVEVLGETGGLGTVATRAEIIERLFKTFVIEKRGQEISTTSKGRQLLELVPAELKSPALTAEWEQQLTAIAAGTLSKEQFMKEMVQFSKQTVQTIKQATKTFKHDNMTGKSCPECGKALLEVNGKRGKMHVCQDRECGYRKKIAQQTNARCPNCHKKLTLRGEGEGQIFVCSCGHREKLSAFKKRREGSGNKKAGKRDVSNYLKKQEEPTNNAMAEALKKLFE